MNMNIIQERRGEERRGDKMNKDEIKIENIYGIAVIIITCCGKSPTVWLSIRICLELNRELSICEESRDIIKAI